MWKKETLSLKSAINKEDPSKIKIRFSLKTPAKVSSKLFLTRTIAKRSEVGDFRGDFNLFCPFNDTSCVSFSFQAESSCGDFPLLVPIPCPLGKSVPPQVPCAVSILQTGDLWQQIQDLFEGSARCENRSPAEQRCLWASVIHNTHLATYSPRPFSFLCTWVQAWYLHYYLW